MNDRRGKEKPKDGKEKERKKRKRDVSAREREKDEKGRDSKGKEREQGRSATLADIQTHNTHLHLRTYKFRFFIAFAEIKPCKPNTMFCIIKISKE